MADIFNKETTFNEAFLKMQRIHTTQEIINDLRSNMLAYNSFYGKYNYEVIISNLVSLCYEASPLMNNKELQEFHLLRKIVDDLQINKPIFNKSHSSNFNGSNNKESLNLDNWDILRNLLFKFEDFARLQIDIHGLASPKKKDASLASIDL